VLTWLVYALAALVMLTAVVAAILAGLALRFGAELLRGLGEGHQEGNSREEGGKGWGS
jgi:hypothetical protein